MSSLNRGRSAVCPPQACLCPKQSSPRGELFLFLHRNDESSHHSGLFSKDVVTAGTHPRGNLLANCCRRVKYARQSACAPLPALSWDSTGVRSGIPVLREDPRGSHHGHHQVPVSWVNSHPGKKSGLMSVGVIPLNPLIADPREYRSMCFPLSPQTPYNLPDHTRYPIIPTILLSDYINRRRYTRKVNKEFIYHRSITISRFVSLNAACDLCVLRGNTVGQWLDGSGFDSWPKVMTWNLKRVESILPTCF